MRGRRARDLDRVANGNAPGMAPRRRAIDTSCGLWTATNVNERTETWPRGEPSDLDAPGVEMGRGQDPEGSI